MIPKKSRKSIRAVPASSVTRLSIPAVAGENQDVNPATASAAVGPSSSRFVAPASTAGGSTCRVAAPTTSHSVASGKLQSTFTSTAFGVRPVKLKALATGSQSPSPHCCVASAMPWVLLLRK